MKAGRPKIKDEFSHIDCRFARSRARLKERRKAQWRAAYAKNPEPNILRVAKWQKANPEKVKTINARTHRKQYLTNPNYKISCTQRSRIWAALRKGKKQDHSEVLVGGVDNLRRHIEGLLPLGWDWTNYGKVWDIDHIRPLASFDLTKIEEQKAAFHYSNTQPLSKIDNQRKGARWKG